MGEDITEIAKHLIALSSKANFANSLGISRPTLDARLSGDSEWKKLEKWFVINELSKQIKK